MVVTGKTRAEQALWEVGAAKAVRASEGWGEAGKLSEEPKAGACWGKPC